MKLKLCLGIFLLFVFILGINAENGINDNQILIGMSTALSGPASYLGTSFKHGAEAYFDYINKKGGIDGRKIKLIAYDDGYEPSKCIPNIKKLISDDKVFCVFGNVGTPTTMAIKPIVAKEKVPLFAPFTGAEPLRKPVQRYILNYRASYYQEAEALIAGIVDQLKKKKVAVFYQDDAYGRVVLKGAEIALEKRGLIPIITATYKRNTEDVGGALATIKSMKPDAVIMVGTYKACAKFIIEGKKSGFNPIYCNVSFVGSDKMNEILGKYGDGEVISQVVPPYTFTELSGVKEYLDVTKKFTSNHKPNFVCLEGYLAAKVFVEGLKKAGKNITREGFIDAVESIRDFDIGIGSKINFSKNSHQGCQEVFITYIKGGKFILFKDWKDNKKKLLD